MYCLFNYLERLLMATTNSVKLNLLKTLLTENHINLYVVQTEEPHITDINNIGCDPNARLTYLWL